MVNRVKSRLGYDDSLDAFGVHGVGGTVGALLTGVFATKLINPALKDDRGQTLGLGMIDGNFGQIGNQAVGIVMAVVLATIGTLAILKLVDLMIGLRVPADQEIEGLDLTSMVKKATTGKAPLHSTLPVVLGLYQGHGFRGC
jgi:Amt family ammonium transporter